MAYIGQEIKGGTFKVLDTSGNTYNGSNVTFSLGSQVGSAAQLLVSHDGVIQKPGTDYSLASGGASITFSTAPASGASIFIVEISGAVGGTITPADNSVGITQLNVSDGSNGQALTTNGSGTLSFSTIASADPSSADGDSLGTASLEWSDLYLADGGIVYFGNDQDVALIHNADKGLKLKSTATSDDTPAIFTLQTGDTDIGDADVIGKIEFQAPDEGAGTDAVLVGAAIQAVAVGDFSSSANAMELQFMTAESATASAKMRIRGDGKVGISPDGAAPDLGTGLHIRTSDTGASVASGGDELVLENGSANCGLSILTANDGIARIFFADDGDSGAGGLDYFHDGDHFRIYTAGSERIRFTGTGTVATGVTSVAGSFKQEIRFSGNPGYGLILSNSSNVNSTEYISFRCGSTQEIGSIKRNGGADAIAFNTSSDYRLKQDIVDIDDGITRLKTLQPRKFKWKSDTSKTVDGFIAHEVTAVPESITGTKDETENKLNVVIDNSNNIIQENVSESAWTEGKTDGTFPSDSTWSASKTVPKYQQIDQAKLVPLLTAALQEAITKIETLEARVKTLEDA